MDNTIPLQVFLIVNSQVKFYKETGQCNNSETPLSKGFSSPQPQKGSP